LFKHQSIKQMEYYEQKSVKNIKKRHFLIICGYF